MKVIRTESKFIRNKRKNILRISNILFLILLPMCLNGQLYIGSSSGVNISGAQDQKFINYDQNKKLTEIYVTNDIDGVFSFLNSVNLSYWGLGKVFKNMA